MNQAAMIILAAGNSSRLGKPKQTLFFQGKTLLAHVIQESKKAFLSPILVITGADADLISSAAIDSGVEFIFNPEWETGMASGIVVGISHLLLTKTDSVIIAVCDQPFVSAELFSMLVKEKEISKKGIVASQYGGTLGTPVLFDRIYFDRLQHLKGQQGAKAFIQSESSDVSSVSFEKGSVDIDTVQDYQQLIAGI